MRAMPPPCGGKLKARSKVGFKTGKGEGGRGRPLPHHFGFDGADVADDAIPVVVGLDRAAPRGAEAPRQRGVVEQKSTRLNSSHLVISYAVFCLKKKKKKQNDIDT